MESILLIGIISVICGAETWNEMGTYAQAKEEFLLRFHKLENSMTSHDPFNRVFSSIDPDEFECCLVEWLSIHTLLNQSITG